MKPSVVKKLNPQRSLDENAARIVRARLGELRSFAPQAMNRDAAVAQHDMRIAAKRLRYVLESTELCFGKPARNARRQARELQDILGELHDCDVAVPRVQRHRSELLQSDSLDLHGRAGSAIDLDPKLTGLAPNRAAYRGLDMLEVYLEARRRLLFDRFNELWIEQEDAGVWDRLDRAAHSVIDAARERRRSDKRAKRAQRGGPASVGGQIDPRKAPVGAARLVGPAGRPNATGSDDA